MSPDSGHPQDLYALNELLPISEISISEFQLISFDVPRYAIAIDVGIRNLGTISIFSETCQGRRWLLDATINYLLALSHVGHSVFVSLADCFLSS